MVFASTVRFTTNTASGPFVWGFVGWVVKWIIVSLTGGFRPCLGCCLFVVLVVLARGLHPVSFPNLEVKPFCADGTAAGRSWESRALPTVSLSGGGGVDPVMGLAPPPSFLFVFPTSTTVFLCLCGGVVFGGGCWATPKIFCVFRGQAPLKVVKDTPAVRRQTY